MSSVKPLWKEQVKIDVEMRPEVDDNLGICVTNL